MRLADLPDRLHEFDAVVSCTASTLPIIGLGAVERALKRRRHRPIFMVDLAVPRDIEPEVKELADVYLYSGMDSYGPAIQPLIRQLNAQADAWRNAEMVRARKRLARGENVDEVMEAMTRALTQKMLHGAMAELNASDPAHREQTPQAITRLFLRSQGQNGL